MDAGDLQVLSVVMAYATQIGQQRFNDASTRGRVKKLCEMIATILAIDTTARSNPVWFEVALLLDLPDSEIQSCLPEHLRTRRPRRRRSSRMHRKRLRQGARQESSDS